MDKAKSISVRSISRITCGHTPRLSTLALSEEEKQTSFHFTTSSRILALVAPNKDVYDMWMVGLADLLQDRNVEIVDIGDSKKGLQGGGMEHKLGL